MAINKTTAGTFRVDFRDQNGRRLRKTFDTLKEAREHDRISKGAITKGEFTAPTSTTVADIAEQWYQRKVDSNAYRYGTLLGWRIHLDRHILPALGALKIQVCTVEAIEKAALAWAEVTSPTTANKVLTTLTAVFKLAQRYGPLRGKENAAALAERLKVSKEDSEGQEVLPDQCYNEDELKQLINATEPGSFERALVMLPVLTGMRIGEILGLQWPAIDFRQGILAVRANLVVSENGGLELATPKSQKSRRYLPM